MINLFNFINKRKAVSIVSSISIFYLSSVGYRYTYMISDHPNLFVVGLSIVLSVITVLTALLSGVLIMYIIYIFIENQYKNYNQDFKNKS